VTVSFPDEGEGAVGSVMIRAAYRPGIVHGLNLAKNLPDVIKVTFENTKKAQ